MTILHFVSVSKDTPDLISWEYDETDAYLEDHPS